MVYVLPELYYVGGALMRIGGFHWMLVLSIVAILPFKYLYARVTGRCSYRLFAKSYEEVGNLTGYLAERIRSLSLIKVYTNEKEELNNGQTAAGHLRKVDLRMAAPPRDLQRHGARGRHLRHRPRRHG